ncbi:hypothetical protein LGQ02_11455 [Bacillus shivajii]|uniref:HesB/YadR/YfhF family protein n=1 Tax=Bacillus shivajii TaxID=1983719 RepID=UPI001CFB7478|nr:iron-sulfur cluster biosynthesis family protein [Bacillus shivajii]UCZ51493.1 hypothetical protein LGQ02_11455 [Bacillus shivajii]
MDLTITEKAGQLYKNEMNLEKGEHITLFVRVGGIGSGGFSAGIYKGQPERDFKTYTVNDITFCVSEDDEWYFDGMIIDFDEDRQKVTFVNDRIEDVTNPN